MKKFSASVMLKCIGLLILSAFLILGMISCDKKIPSISYLDSPADSDTEDNTPIDSDSGDDTTGESQDPSSGVGEEDDDEANWTPFY